MNDEELKTAIADVLKDDRDGASPYQEVVQKLRALAGAIEASLGPGDIEVRVEAGHRVHLGQQYSFVVRVPKAGLREVDARAQTSSRPRSCAPSVTPT